MALHQPRALGDRPQHRVLVHIVELVAAARVAPHTARNHEHRDSVEKSLGDSAGRVRDSRGRHDQERAEAHAAAAYRVRHERTAALVGDQHGRDERGFPELVVDLGVVHARDAERVSDAEFLQGLS